MDEEKRINGGYEIMESCTIGNNELVIGHNAKAPNPYVCWYCKDGSPQPVCVLVLQGRIGLFLGILLQSAIRSKGKADRAIQEGVPPAL